MLKIAVHQTPSPFTMSLQKKCTALNFIYINLELKNCNFLAKSICMQINTNLPVTPLPILHTFEYKKLNKIINNNIIYVTFNWANSTHLWKCLVNSRIFSSLKYKIWIKLTQPNLNLELAVLIPSRGISISFPHLTSHFRKWLIYAIVCDIYNIEYKSVRLT